MGEDGAGRTELQVKECRRTGWYTHVGVTSAGVQRAAVSARDKQYPSASPVQAPTAPAWQPGCPSRGPGLPSTRAGPAAQAAPPGGWDGAGQGRERVVRPARPHAQQSIACIAEQAWPHSPANPHNAFSPAFQAIKTHLRALVHHHEVGLERLKVDDARLPARKYVNPSWALVQ